MTSRSPPVVLSRSSGGREPTPILTRRLGGGYSVKAPKQTSKTDAAAESSSLKTRHKKDLNAVLWLVIVRLYVFFHAMLCLKEKKKEIDHEPHASHAL